VEKIFACRFEPLVGIRDKRTPANPGIIISYKSYSYNEPPKKSSVKLWYSGRLTGFDNNLKRLI